MSVNKVILIGNLGDNVKVTSFEDGNKVAKFPIATSETYLKKDTNEKVTRTEWHTIVVKNKLAENCEKYLKKGSKVYVDGSIRSRKWEDENKVTHYISEIHSNSVEFLTPKESQVEIENQ